VSFKETLRSGQCNFLFDIPTAFQKIGLDFFQKLHITWHYHLFEYNACYFKMHMKNIKHQSLIWNVQEKQ
jgi:hypothetical protein